MSQQTPPPYGTPQSHDSPWGGYAQAPARASTATILGQVMFLVGVALGFAALGAYMAQDMNPGSARILTFVAVGMLFAQAFISALRTGAVGIGWLMMIALALGIGIGPVLNYYLDTRPAVVYQAAGATALITLAMGFGGMAFSKDMVRWMKPVSIAMLILCAVTWIGIIAISANPIFSVLIAGMAALLLFIDFNYVRHHADEDDVVWIATGIFVSIINIFLSMLSLFGND